MDSTLLVGCYFQAFFLILELYIMRLWPRKTGVNADVNSMPQVASAAIPVEASSLEATINPNARGAAIDIAGITIPLDLANRHERNYFARHYLGAIYPQADIDRLIFRVLVRRGDIVLDAGSNIGVTVAELLDAGALHVHAFEPVPILAKRLQAINDARLTSYPWALGEKVGDIPIWISQAHNQGSTIDPRMVEHFAPIFGESPVSCSVPLRTLDDACPSVEFDFMKVDVEGAEAAFLCGAVKTFSRRLPRAISMELYDRFFEEAKHEADKYFEYCYRCFIRKTDYSLQFTEWRAPYDPELFHHTSPTYIFTNSPVIGGSIQ